MDSSCLDCPHCYDDDEALYCVAEMCVREGLRSMRPRSTHAGET